MKKILLVLPVVLLAISSCGPGRQKDEKTGSGSETKSLSGTILVEGSQTLMPLMLKWQQEFKKSQPDVKFSVKPCSDGKSLKQLTGNKIQIAMISRKLTADEVKTGFWAVSVAKDAVLPVVSFDNSNLQKIVLAGVTKDKLAKAFTGKIKTWGQLLQLKSNDPINVFKLSDTSDVSQSWAEFLNVGPTTFTGTEVYNQQDIPGRVAADKNGIGYCSITEIFNIQTGQKKRNLYVLPVDLNANNQADDNELVFDKLDDVKNAVSTGKYPAPPARELFLVCKSVPTDAVTVAFIKWVLTIGQNNCSEYGFVNIEKNQASAYLKQLK
ncbi:MAG TPA: substrate-binding domain-containing protein [Bacteroidales bacterium]|nr:substrate-binding domain-containing protein [Bacteroidales bacterium]